MKPLEPIVEEVTKQAPEAATDTVASSAVAAPEPEQSKEPKKESRTPGDNTFDWITYGLVGGVGNFLLSMGAGYWARYGGGSKQIAGLSKSMQNSGMSKSSAEDAIMTTALMMGGNMIVVPIKMLENQRADIVNSVNKNVGCETTVTEQEAEKTKQSWGSLIKSRLIAWSIVFASFKGAAHALGPENFEKFEKDFAKNVVCNPLGAQTHVNGQETKIYKYGRIAALDLFATVASASILYVASRMMAAKRAKEEEPHAAEPQKLAAPAAPATAENDMAATPVSVALEQAKTVEIPSQSETVKECATCPPKTKIARTYTSQTERIMKQKQELAEGAGYTLAT